MNIETWTQEDGYGWTDPNGKFVLKADHDALIREAREIVRESMDTLMGLSAVIPDIAELSKVRALKQSCNAFLDKTKELA
jgi:hypothetical protein